MGKVIASITTSVDGYVTGPDDKPGTGLGVGGERLHYWAFGGPWTYDDGPKGDPSGAPPSCGVRTRSSSGCTPSRRAIS